MNIHPEIHTELAHQRAAERRRLTERMGLVRAARRSSRPSWAGEELEPVTIRQSTEGDARAIAEIAALEHKPVPAGRALVAIRGGRLQAVLDPDTGAVLADPFLPTETAVRLVRTYADAA